MDNIWGENMRKIILLLAVYLLIFWVGFRMGEIHNRMKNRIKVEKIIIPAQSEIKSYYVIEEASEANSGHVSFREVNGEDVMIKFLYNEKLKPLLKSRNLKIYTSEGDRVY